MYQVYGSVTFTVHIFLEFMFVLIVCFAQKYHTLSHAHKNNPDLLVDNRFPGAREMFVERTGIKINVFFKATSKFETHQLQEFVMLPPVLTGWHTNVKFCCARGAKG